jgi:hypothetical protein
VRWGVAALQADAAHHVEAAWIAQDRGKSASLSPLQARRAMDESNSLPSDQLFFVSLAQKGREAWKDWREKHGRPVTFEGVNFQNLPTCAVAEFKFNANSWSSIGKTKLTKVTLDYPKKS